MSDKKSLFSKVLKVAQLQAYNLRKKTIYALDLAKVDFSGLNPSNSVRFTKGEVRDVQDMAQRYDLDYDPIAFAFAKGRLNHGDKIIIGYMGNRPVCYGWLMFDQMDLQFKNYRPLPNRVAYSYKIYTSPDVRRMGVYQAYYRFMIEHLRKQNQRYLITWIDDSNQASINAHKKFGVKPIGVIHSRTVLGFKSHRLVSDNSLLSQKVLSANP